MGRLPRNRFVLQLLVAGLIALVQVAGSMTIGAAFKAASSSSATSSTIAEEEVDDDALVEELLPLVIETGSQRWTVEQSPPAPVHLEREGRPPPA